ncbi:hypothetical protein [Sediminitomix flava]|nr:hypothetical protein [Sediminitomix flava]
MERQISIFSLIIFSFFTLASCEETKDTTPPEVIELFVNTSQVAPLDTADLVLTTEASNLDRDEDDLPPFNLSGELRDNINLLSYRVRVSATDDNPMPEGVLFPPLYELDTIVQIGGARVRINREFPLTNQVARNGNYDFEFNVWDAEQLQAPPVNNTITIVNNSPEFHVTSIDRIPEKDSLFIPINEPILIQGNVSDRDEDLKSGRYQVQFLRRTLDAPDTWVTLETFNFSIASDSAIFDNQYAPDTLAPHRILFYAQDDAGAKTEFNIPFSVKATDE